jgi:hypothetical protein
MCRVGLRKVRSWPRSIAVTALALLGAGLAGCSSGPSMPSLSSLMGSSSNTNSTAAGNASAAYTPPTDFECPGVSVRQDAGTLSVSANPAEPTALNLRYQVGVVTTARECHLLGSMLTMKVGMQGRVLLGPAGGPGQIDVPLRFAVVQEGIEPKTIVTKLQVISVSVPPNDGNVLFTHVEDNLTFPMPKGGAIDSYVVYIGFDPLGAQELQKKKRPAPRTGRARRKTS